MELEAERGAVRFVQEERGLFLSFLLPIAWVIVFVSFVWFLKPPLPAGLGGGVEGSVSGFRPLQYCLCFVSLPTLCGGFLIRPYDVRFTIVISGNNALWMCEKNLNSLSVA